MQRSLGRAAGLRFGVVLGPHPADLAVFDLIHVNGLSPSY